MTERQQMELDAFEKSALELVFGKNYESPLRKGIRRHVQIIHS